MLIRVSLTSSWLALALVACRPSIDPEIVAMIGTEHVNHDLTLAEFTEAPRFFTNDYELIMTNESREPFMMPEGYASRIMAYVDGEWVEVENLIHENFPPGALIVPGKGGRLYENELYFGVWPDLPPGATILRVIVTGERPNGETVGAYVDIPLP